MRTKLGSTKFVFIDRRTYGTFNISLLFNFIKSAIQKKNVMKEKPNPSLRSTEESIVNQNSFRVLSKLYITDFFVKQEK